MEDLHDVAIKDLAAKTHVSTATISRFCKEIGLQSFAELRNLINDHKRATEPRYDFQNTEDSNSLADSYLSAVQRDIDSLKSTLDLNKLNSLVDDIYHYQNVVTFGAMHMETISLMLQNNLFRCKKIIETRLTPNKQIDFVEDSQEDLLVIIFSLSGNYVREYISTITRKEHLKIYVITMNEEVAKLRYVQETILLPDNANSFSAHPVDSLLLVQLITLIYYQKYVQ